MTNEEYVLANWERADLCENRARAAFSISLGGRGFTRASTRDLLEQIREIEEERAMLCGKILLEDRDVAITKRILARLEAALADLKRGIKDPSAVQCAVNSPYDANSDQIVSDSPDDAPLRRDQEDATCVKPTQEGTTL